MVESRIAFYLNQHYLSTALHSGQWIWVIVDYGSQPEPLASFFGTKHPHSGQVYVSGFFIESHSRSVSGMR